MNSLTCLYRCNGPLVKVVVGLETFTIHRDLLSHFSQILEIKTEDVAAEDSTIILSGCHSEILHIFNHFVYSGQIFGAKEDDLESNPSVGEYPSDSEGTRLTNAWILANHIGSIAFKDACTDALLPRLMR